MAYNNTKCGCDFNIKTVGNCDISRLNINGSNKSHLNWTEILIPEILCIPEQKPDIEAIDQVYANIILDNVKLIETPFAYKKYILYSFYQALTGIDTALPGLLTTLTGDVTTLLDPITTPGTGLLALLNTLSTTLGALTAIPGVNALITIVNNGVIDINDLISNIDQTVVALGVAVDNLIAAIAADPLSAEAICEAIQAVIDILNSLTNLVNSLIPLLTNLLDSLSAAVALVDPVLGAAVITAVTIVTDALDLLINTTLTPLLATVITSIGAILSLLAPIDCENPYAFTIIGNEEGTCLSGRKLIIEGTLKQKVVYTAEVDVQSVHSAHYEVPFIAFIIPYAKFEGLNYQENIQVYDPETGGPIFIDGYMYNEEIGINVDLCEEFNIEKYIEDIYVYALDKRRVFKNVTVFLKAKPENVCS